MNTYRFRDPRDHWPEPFSQLPEPLPGRHGLALAILAVYVPSLPKERRLVIAQAMWNRPTTRAIFRDILVEYAPDLFLPDPSEDA